MSCFSSCRDLVWDKVTRPCKGDQDVLDILNRQPRSQVSLECSPHKLQHQRKNNSFISSLLFILLFIRQNPWLIHQLTPSHITLVSILIECHQPSLTFGYIINAIIHVLGVRLEKHFKEHNFT